MLKKTKLNYSEPVYDLTVPGTECFYANGILIHNCLEVLEPTQPFQRLEDVGSCTVETEDGRRFTAPNNLTYTDSEGNSELIRYIPKFAWVKEFGGFEINGTVMVVQQTRPSIALCTLASMNWGKFKNPEDMREACHAVVRGLDNILSYQEYFAPQSEMAMQEFRHLGIGVTNLAYWHAKRGLRYGDPDALEEVSRWMEHQTYYITEASIQLAAERGVCKRFQSTRWATGEFPWERASENLKEISSWKPELDWEHLRKELNRHGIRNAFLQAVAPVESSSVCINSTNGVEIPKDLVSVKSSRGSVLVQVVPDYEKLKNKYQTLWELDDCEPYLKTVAVMARFIDQGLSTNTFYDPGKYEGGKIPKTIFLRNIMNAMRWGIKTLYYNVTRKDGVKIEIEQTEQKAPATIEPTVEETEEHCESCVL